MKGIYPAGRRGDRGYLPLRHRKSIGVDVGSGYCDIAIQRMRQESNIEQDELI